MIVDKQVIENRGKIQKAHHKTTRDIVIITV